jgi:hypothetical protein
MTLPKLANKVIQPTQKSRAADQQRSQAALYGNTPNTGAGEKINAGRRFPPANQQNGGQNTVLANITRNCVLTPVLDPGFRSMNQDLSKLNEQELLRLHAAIIDELENRKVVRTKNNPFGDYTECLVSKALKLKLVNNSATGYDGIDENGIRSQIKGRRITPENTSRQLSAIRKLNEKDFDYLVGVVFDENYSVIEAIVVPHKVVAEYSTYREHVNAHILHLQGTILKDSRIRSIRESISS